MAKSFSIQLKIASRLGAKSSCNTREFCISFIDRYSLTNTEVEKILEMQPGESFYNKDVVITRRK